MSTAKRSTAKTAKARRPVGYDRMRRVGSLIRLGLPGHPGTPWMVFYAALGYVAGGWFGAGIILAIYGPFYLYGAFARGRDEARRFSQMGKPEFGED